MTPGIALEVVDTGLANLPRQARDYRRDRQPEPALVPDLFGKPSSTVPAAVALPSQSLAPTAAFAAGLISHQTPPHDAMIDRQRLTEAQRPLPERSELPLTDRLV